MNDPFNPENPKIKIVSYNVLADICALPSYTDQNPAGIWERFFFSPKDKLHVETRFKNIAMHLAAVNADLIALQETERSTLDEHLAA